jgi:hypothetical protein
LSRGKFEKFKENVKILGRIRGKDIPEGAEMYGEEGVWAVAGGITCEVIDFPK